MSINQYTIDILTPNRIVAANVPVESLLVPTTRGQINILGSHTHIVTKLATGQISLFGGADDPDRHFAVTTGIIKVLDGKITILANTAEEAFEIDAERAKLALSRAEDVLATSDTLSDEDITKYRRKIERAKLRIQLSGNA